MPINLRNSEAAVRENRLGAITGYNGSIRELAGKASGCSLQGKERCFNQASSCSSGCAQGYLSGIRDVSIVNHAPVGCSADSIAGNVQRKWGETIRGWERTNISLFSTNMNESDTVFGSTEKLQDAIKEAYRRNEPKAIFVTTSCVSGVIGEDILSAVERVQEELPVPVIPVFCEGFKSKVWSSGFDAAFHAILTRVVKPPQRKTNKVNMINFRGSAREEIVQILARFDLEPVFLVPFSTIEELEKLSESAASISICGTLGSYIGNGLEEKFGVPYIKSLQPHGIAGMEEWLRELAKVVGKEAEAEAYIAEQRALVLPELGEIRSKLSGYKAVVGMGPSFAFNYIRVLRELGVEVIWGTAWHFDQQYDHGACPESVTFLSQEDDLPISVSDQQSFELLNLLNRLKPDLYVSRHGGTSVWTTKMGIASVMVADEYSAFGYQGLLQFGYRLIDALTNRSLAKTLSKRMKLPYTDWWLQQDSFAMLEQEEVAPL